MQQLYFCTPINLLSHVYKVNAATEQEEIKTKEWFLMKQIESLQKIREIGSFVMNNAPGQQHALSPNEIALEMNKINETLSHQQVEQALLILTEVEAGFHQVGAKYFYQLQNHIVSNIPQEPQTMVA